MAAMTWDPLEDPLPDTPSAASDLARAAAQVWQSLPGRLLLDHLAQQTVGRVLPPTASDAELRHLEGQRALMNHIKILIKRGQSND